MRFPGLASIMVFAALATTGTVSCEMQASAGIDSRNQVIASRPAAVDSTKIQSPHRCGFSFIPASTDDSQNFWTVSQGIWRDHLSAMTIDPLAEFNVLRQEGIMIKDSQIFTGQAILSESEDPENLGQVEVRDFDQLESQMDVSVGAVEKNGFRLVQVGNTALNTCVTYGFKTTALSDGQPALLIRGPIIKVSENQPSSADFFKETHSKTRIFTR